MREPIPYASPGRRGGAGARPFHFGIFLWSLLLIGTWTLMLVFVLPMFEVTLTDFKLELPLLTKLLLSARTFVLYGGFLILLAIPVALGFIAGSVGPGGRWMLSALITLIFGLVVALSILGIFLPMMTLIQGMSGSSGR